MEEKKTSPSTWKASLSLLLSNLNSELGQFPKIAILGVGNELRSDDAAGILVVRALSNSKWATRKERVLLIEAGPEPENRTGEIRTFAPNFVLNIDAANVGEEAGRIQWVAEEDIDGMSASTHSLPLSMLARYLRLELNCSVSLLGIQPASNEVGEGLSQEVLQSVTEVANGLNELIGSQRASMRAD